jgi:RimJ/RimL family protein N-acetyltransferase
MTAFLAHHREDRRVEVGHIWYVPTARRTTANTEVVLLMGGHAFGSLACRRLEWKCDARNAASRASAERLGFTFEGVFRQHMIVKGANRDTAWYSVIDREWPRIERALRAWLYETPRDDRGKPVRRLEEVRATVG